MTIMSDVLEERVIISKLLMVSHITLFHTNNGKSVTFYRSPDMSDVLHLDDALIFIATRSQPMK